MAKANVTSQNWLKLLFQAVAIANIADNAGTSPITTISVALHTADPGATGNQSTSEAAYSGYTRITVTRNATNWPLTGQTINPSAAISFPASTASGTTITHFSVGKTSSGATDMFYSGTVTPNIAIGAAGITPQLTTATAITES